MYASPTILLGNIKLIDNDNEIDMTDHLWFNLTKGFKNLGILCNNDLVSFSGRVTKYTKGYQGLKPGVNKPVQYDYKIERPSKVKLESNYVSKTPNTYSDWPDENWKICNMIYDMYSSDYIRRDVFKPYPEQNYI